MAPARYSHIWIFVGIIGLTKGNEKQKNLGFYSVLSFVCARDVDPKVVFFPDLFETTFKKIGSPHFLKNGNSTHEGKIIFTSTPSRAPNASSGILFPATAAPSPRIEATETRTEAVTSRMGAARRAWGSLSEDSSRRSRRPSPSSARDLFPRSKLKYFARFPQIFLEVKKNYCRTTGGSSPIKPSDS